MDWPRVLEQLAGLARSSVDDDNFAHDAAFVVLDSLHADTVVIRRVVEGEMRYVAGAGELTDALRQHRVGVERMLTRGPTSSRLPWVTATIDPKDRDVVGPIGHIAQGLIYTPLFSGDDIQGTLTVASSAPRVFADDEVAFVAVTGALLAGAFATSTRVKELEEQQRRNRSLLDVIFAASRARSLTETLREVCAVVAETSVGERCSILLFKEDEETLVPVMSQGHVVDPELYKRFRSAPTQGMREAVWRDAIMARKPLIFSRAIELAPDDPIWRAWVENFSIKSIANFPVYAGDRFLGLIAVDTFAREVEFSDEEVEFLSSIANQIGVLIEKAQLEEQLREQASTDPLTRLYNRRFVEEQLKAELSRARRSQEPLALLLLDVDELKKVNDRYGHLVGDALLRNVGQALKSACRVSDIVARFAGDEFLAILPATSKSEARKVVERVLGLLDRAPIDTAEGKLPLQVTVGLAEFPTDGEDATSLFAAADADLYRHKPVKSFLP
ncbi:MAG TPA: sensor domain-containing diguanylate cyclase [Dehalococcoidia bacterium]|nr:sensor domain-containing diguanylate cyclase [Dehalococcoidia bacterium]